MDTKPIETFGTAVARAWAIRDAAVAPARAGSRAGYDAACARAWAAHSAAVARAATTLYATPE